MQRSTPQTRSPRRALAFATLVLATLGCNEGKIEGDDTGPGDDTGAQCGTTQGFVSGTVTGPYDTEPAEGAHVTAALESDPSVRLTAATNEAGLYELNLEPGTYWVYAEAEGCYSTDHTVTVEACEEFVVDIDITECDVADKPNLYLYPEADTPMAVRVEHGPKQAIVASDPVHGERGWRGVAHPDGTFTQQGERAPFLFYEVSLAPEHGPRLQREAGWCLPAEGAVEAMADILADYGFNAREVDDFVDAWRHDLPPADAYTVLPQREVAFMAELHMDPALPVDRLWLLVEEGSGCAPLYEPEVVPMDRRGAHGVEWGVILHGLGR